jgi:hypothetical protein
MNTMAPGKVTAPTGVEVEVWCTHVEQCGFVCYTWKIDGVWKTAWVKVQ